MGNLSSVGLGVHQQSVQVLNVSNEVDLVTRWVHELGLLVGTVTDVWLTDGASESSSDTRVNTLLLSPVLGNSVISVRVMSLELLGVLLNNLDGHCWVSICTFDGLMPLIWLDEPDGEKLWKSGLEWTRGNWGTIWKWILI